MPGILFYLKTKNPGFSEFRASQRVVKGNPQGLESHSRDGPESLGDGAGLETLLHQSSAQHPPAVWEGLARGTVTSKSSPY